jgi:hypothetical protein
MSRLETVSRHTHVSSRSRLDLWRSRSRSRSWSSRSRSRNSLAMYRSRLGLRGERLGFGLGLGLEGLVHIPAINHVSLIYGKRLLYLERANVRALCCMTSLMLLCAMFRSDDPCVADRTKLTKLRKCLNF